MRVLRVVWLIWTFFVAIVVGATYGDELWPVALVSLIISFLFTVWVWTRYVPGSRDRKDDDGYLPGVRK